MAHRGEALDAPFRQRGHTHLQREVGDDGGQVAVAGALAEPVDRALHVAGPAADSGQRVGYAATGVVVQMHTDDDVVTEVVDHLTDDVFHVEGQRATIGVAQHDVGGPLERGRLEHPQGELGVLLVAVEEVLGVEHDPQTFAAQEAHRVGHHGHTLVEVGLQGLGDVVLRRLAHDAHRRRARLHQVAERGVVVHLALHPPCRPEGDERGRVEPQLGARPPEELLVLGIGAGPSALDEVDAEVVELLGDTKLVVDAERDPFYLGAVAQRRVEDLYGRWHPVRHVPPNPCNDRPDHGRPCRTPPSLPSSSAPGTGRSGRRPS